MKEKRQYILIIVLILAVLLIDQTIKYILIANENIQVSNNAIKVHYEKSEEQCSSMPASHQLPYQAYLILPDSSLYKGRCPCHIKQARTGKTP